MHLLDISFHNVTKTEVLGPYNAGAPSGYVGVLMTVGENWKELASKGKILTVLQVGVQTKKNRNNQLNYSCSVIRLEETLVTRKITKLL